MSNLITQGDGVVVVELDPQDLLMKPVYDRDGSRSFKSGLLFHHAIQGLAWASMMIHAKALIRPFQLATVEFKDGRFIVTFAETHDTLPELVSGVGKLPL